MNSLTELGARPFVGGGVEMNISVATTHLSGGGAVTESFTLRGTIRKYYAIYAENYRD